MLRERESDKCEAKYRYYLHWHFESTKSSRLAENATDESDDANAFVNGDLTVTNLNQQYTLVLIFSIIAKKSLPKN